MSSSSIPSFCCCCPNNLLGLPPPQCCVVVKWLIALVLLIGFTIGIKTFAGPDGDGDKWAWLGSQYLLLTAVTWRFLCKPLIIVYYCNRRRHHHHHQQQQQQQQQPETNPSALTAPSSILVDPTLPQVTTTDDNKAVPTREGEKCTCADDEGTAADTEHNLEVELATPAPGTSTMTTTTTSRNRDYYLDNLKTFLTIIVVLHHCTTAFGGGGEGAWYLVLEGVVPNDDGDDIDTTTSTSFRSFQIFARSFVIINQAYFMPLFFFVSAYFVPVSYQSKVLNNKIHQSGGQQEDDVRYDHDAVNNFVIAKRNRLYFPLLMVFWLISPTAIMMSECAVRGGGNNTTTLSYIPSVGPAWFVLWLLVFVWVYLSVAEASSRNRQEEQQQSSSALAAEEEDDALSSADQQQIEELEQGGHQVVLSAAAQSTATAAAAAPPPPPSASSAVPFPATWKRTVYGFGICGMVQMILTGSLGADFSLAGMPMATGSLSCDIFMFIAGCLARKYGWLNTSSSSSSSPSSLKDQLDISPYLQVAMTAVEATCMILLFEYIEQSGDEFFFILFFAIAGPFCLDMAVSIVMIFQGFFNKTNTLSKLLSRSAYAVYLVHPVVVVGFTWVYIEAFNAIMIDDPATEITFPDHATTGVGGEDYHWIGWVLVSVASLVVVWPLSYILTQLPILKNML